MDVEQTPPESKVQKLEEETSSKTIYFITNDGGRTESELKYALMMNMFKEELEGDDDVTDLFVKEKYGTKAIMEKIIDFLKHYEHDPFEPIERPLKSSNMKDVVPDWYASFVDIELGLELYALTNVVNYLDIPPLLDLLCARIAAPMKGKTPDEIRTLFNLPPDEPPKPDVIMEEDDTSV